MTIGIDASRANETERTGTEVYAYELIQEFKKINQKDKLRLYSPSSLQNGLEILPDNFKSVVLKSPIDLMWTQIRLSLEMLLNKPDVLFVPAHTIPIICPVKTIVTCHDIGFERYPELYAQKSIGPKSGIKSWIVKNGVKFITGFKYTNNELDYHRWSMRFALKHAETIIVPSEFTKREILDVYKISSDKIKVIYNGFNQAEFQPEKNREIINETLQKFNIDNNFLLFVGRLEEKKNIAGMLEAFALARRKDKNLQDTDFVLAGRPGYGYEKIEQTIEKLNIKNNVKILGWISSEEKIHLLSSASIFLFATNYEGFGFPVLEAFSCQLPVITSISNSCQEVAGDAAWLVDPKNSEEISNAIVNLFNNQNLRQEYINKGLKRVNLFSWEKCAKEIMAVLENE